jgi:hypothetical protein
MSTSAKTIIINLLITLAAVSITVTGSAKDHKMSRQEVLNIFQQYITLNDEFLSSVKTGVGRSGKSYKDLKKIVEDYAEGAFHNALPSAEEITCAKKDRVVLSSLFKVIISTSNSADESPAWILGGIYVCQPSLVENEMAKLQPEDREHIYNNLEFGFENVATTKPKNDKRIIELRKRLAALALSTRK